MNRPDPMTEASAAFDAALDALGPPPVHESTSARLRRVEQERDTLRLAAPKRCWSCEHTRSFHQPDGCWFTVVRGRPDSVVSCPCEVPREACEERDVNHCSQVGRLTETALLAHVRDRHVLEREDDSKAYLHLPGRDPIDVTVQMWAWLADGWVWLPPDTLVWHLTDAGRATLEDGKP